MLKGNLEDEEENLKFEKKDNLPFFGSRTSPNKSFIINDLFGCIL